MKIKLKVRKIFFPIYNGVRFFSALYVMSDICFTYYLFSFSVQDTLFPQVLPCKFIFPRNQSAGYFFGLEITQNPSKGKIKRLLSRQILICQSLLKPFATIGDKTLQESGRIRFYLPLPGESVR